MVVESTLRDEGVLRETLAEGVYRSNEFQLPVELLEVASLLLFLPLLHKSFNCLEGGCFQFEYCVILASAVVAHWDWVRF